MRDETLQVLKVAWTGRSPAECELSFDCDAVDQCNGQNELVLCCATVHDVATSVGRLRTCADSCDKYKMNYFIIAVALERSSGCINAPRVISSGTSLRICRRSLYRSQFDRPRPFAKVATHCNRFPVTSDFAVDDGSANARDSLTENGTGNGKRGTVATVHKLCKRRGIRVPALYRRVPLCSCAKLIVGRRPVCMIGGSTTSRAEGKP